MEGTIGIKQLHKDLGRIARRVKRGERILVLKHRTPMFVLTPYQEETFPVHTPRYGLADLQKFQLKGGDKNINKKIDKIVYGV